MAESKLSPLQHNVQITNTDGTPTPYFIQLLQQLYEEKAITDGAVGNAILAGAGLTGGGNLAAGPVTLSASVQAILDLVSTTRGAILYRGAAVWSALLPGAAGNFLKTNGAGADPAWAAAGGGGGGGGTPTIRSVAFYSYNAASYNVVFPVGSAVGDLMVVFWENGFNGITGGPAGWTNLSIRNDGWTNGACIAKIMTAGDIATGFVTVTAGGSFNGVAAAVCVQTGTFTAVDKVIDFCSAGSASVASWPITGMYGAANTDRIFGVISTRGAMNIGVSAGLTILNNINAASASGVLCTYNAALLDALGIHETATYPVGNNGTYICFVALK